MILVLDSSVLCTDFRLESVLMRVLFQNSHLLGYSLAIPEVVIREVVNKFREKLTQNVQAIETTLNKTGRKIGRSIRSPISMSDVAIESRYYEQFLRGHFEGVGALVLSVPKTSHDEMIDRDLKRQKPFSLEGRGYRDTLIWISILEMAQTSQEPIAFITLNKKDFAAADGQLHPHLISDLETCGLSTDRVILYLELRDFVEREVITKLPAPAQTLARFIQDAHPGFRLEQVLEAAFEESLVGWDVSSVEVGKPDEYETITVSSILEIHSVEVEDERESPSGERILELTAFTSCDFNVFVFKGDLWTLEQDKDETLTVWDYDWNERYVAACFASDIDVRAYITLDMDDMKVSSVEIIDVTGTYY